MKVKYYSIVLSFIFIHACDLSKPEPLGNLIININEEASFDCIVKSMREINGKAYVTVEILDGRGKGVPHEVLYLGYNKPKVGERGVLDMETIHKKNNGRRFQETFIPTYPAIKPKLRKTNSLIDKYSQLNSSSLTPTQIE